MSFVTKCKDEFKNASNPVIIAQRREEKRREEKRREEKRREEKISAQLCLSEYFYKDKGK